MNKHLIWVIGLIIIFAMVCGTLIHLNKNPYVLRFEIDNNTLEAVKSIEWEEINSNDDFCYYPSTCYSNYSQYLEQFPNGTLPSTICHYAIYCDGLRDFKWEGEKE